MKQLLRLYPKAWRTRYEEEFVALLNQKASSPFDAFDIFMGVIDAHLRPQVSVDRVKPERRSLVNGNAFTRWSGLGSAMGGILLVLGIFGASTISDDEYPYTYGVGDVLMSLLISTSLLLMLLGLVGLYSRLGALTGLFGRGSLIIAMIGAFTFLVSALLELAEILQWPAYRDWWSLMMIGLMVLLLGTSLFAIAGLRAGILPTWGAVVCLVGGLVTMATMLLSMVGFSAWSGGGEGAISIVMILFFLLFIAGWVWTSYTLWTNKPAIISQPKPTTG